MILVTIIAIITIAIIIIMIIIMSWGPRASPCLHSPSAQPAGRRGRRRGL